MADIWIKMRADLREDPAVVAMSLDTGADPDLIVGKLHRFWSWSDKHTKTGAVARITAQWIDEFVGMKSFADSLARAGWLYISDDGIRIPNFKRHNGKSAKRRAEDTRRKSVRRMSAKHADKNGTREEKIREDKSIKGVNPIKPPAIAFPAALDSPGFADAWCRWVDHRTEIKKPLKPTQAAAQLKQFATWGLARSLAAIDHTITMGWQGIKEPEASGHRGSLFERPPGPDVANMDLGGDDD